MYKMFGGNMIVVAFYLKMHQNKIFFLFLKVVFDISASK
jgi:hypothetical protein